MSFFIKIEAFAKLAAAICEAPATKGGFISTKPIALAIGEER
jgi:hypothetical protein